LIWVDGMRVRSLRRRKEHIKSMHIDAIKNTPERKEEDGRV